MKDLISNQLSSWNIEGVSNTVLTVILLTIILIFLNFLIYYLINFILNLSYFGFARNTKRVFKQKLIKNGAIRNLALLIPLIITKNLTDIWFSDFQNFLKPINFLFKLFIVLVFFRFLKSVAKASRDYLLTLEKYKDKPLESYLQVVMISLNILSGIVLFSMFTGISTWKFIGSLGAASAVLMLIFKDTIMGFVSSIQVSVNNVVKVGDRIEMPSFHIDGTVTDINLNTVKVKGADNTVSTFPTYALVSETIKNWRGVKEIESRRIKRAIHISSNSIGFLSTKNMDDLKKIKLLEPILNTKYRDFPGADIQKSINIVAPTNLTLFREYVIAFLKSHPDIRQDMDVLVRMLDPYENGIPLEIYAYSTTPEWILHEQIMSEILEHIIAASPFFELRIVETFSSWQHG